MDKHTLCDKRQLVVYHHAIGKYCHEIANLLQMSKSTAQY